MSYWLKYILIFGCISLVYGGAYQNNSTDKFYGKFQSIPPQDSLSTKEISKLKNNQVEGEVGFGLISIGTLIIGLGEISPQLILLFGLFSVGIALVILGLYLSFKNNFKLNMPHNIIAAILYVIFGIIILASLLALVFLGLAVGLALLISSLLAIVIPTSYIGLGFIGLGLAYLLFKQIRYWLRKRKAKKYGIK